MKPIDSAAELYAHAIAIEQEAAERYSEFAQRMGDLGNDAVAEIFANLADAEASHLQSLRRRARVVPDEDGERRPYPPLTPVWMQAMPKDRLR